MKTKKPKRKRSTYCDQCGHAAHPNGPCSDETYNGFSCGCGRNKLLNPKIR